MNLVIIGNGVAGISCARHVRKRLPHARIQVISDESDHFYARTALMYIFMGHMTYGHTKPYEDHFWEKNRIELIRDRAEGIDVSARVVRLGSGAELSYDRLLLATGSRPRRGGWPKEDLRGIQGLYGLPDLAQMERDTEGVERAVVVGGGLIGIELAEMLHARGIGVTMLVREPHYYGSILPQEEGEMIASEIRRHGIDLRMGTTVSGFLGDDEGRVRAVMDSDGEEIPAQWVGVAIGVEPNVELAEAAGIEVSKGILVDEVLRTSAPDVFAAGDCAQLRVPVADRKPVEPIWYVAREQGMTVARTIVGEPLPYRPGVFYNSAKFFTLEWQIYGRVLPVPTEEVSSLFWKDDRGRRCLRIDHDRETGAVRGFSSIGIRLRQEICQEWIASRTSVSATVASIGHAIFDGEFSEQIEHHLVAAHNRHHPESPISLRASRGWRRWMSRDPRRLTGTDIPPGSRRP